MDVIYASGRATAAQIRERMPDPPGYSSVRALLRILEQKGHVRHEQEGPRYVYVPAVPAGKARRAALTHLVRTFFQGSAERAVTALLESSDTRLTAEELDRLEQLIDQARRKGT